jgi:hypothetical protein
VAFHLGASMQRLELAAIAATCASVWLITYRRLGDLRGFRAACAHAEKRDRSKGAKSGLQNHAPLIPEFYFK